MKLFRRKHQKRQQQQKAKDNTGTTETGAAAQPETEETTAADDTKLSDLPGAVEETETEPGFERVGVLKGETYNLVALDQTITARAFTAKLSDMGFDKDELESQGHIINYMIDPVGSAELVKAPKLTRDGAEVTFGVIPQTGYKITEVTANGGTGRNRSGKTSPVHPMQKELTKLSTIRSRKF